MTRVGIAGFGAIGRELVRRIAAGLPGVELAAVAARDRERAQTLLAELGIDLPVVAIDELEQLSDVVVECVG